MVMKKQKTHLLVFLRSRLVSSLRELRLWVVTKLLVPEQCVRQSDREVFLKKIETKLRNWRIAWTSRWWQGKDCEWAGFHDLGSRAGCRIWAHCIFWISKLSSLLSSHDPPVMGTYGRLLLGVVPVCAVKRRVVGEGKKTTLLGFQGEFIFSVWVDITSWY